MKKKIIVSKLDLIFLETIRQNVKRTLLEAAVKFDNSGLVLLDIAPQDYAGAKEFFKSSTIKTLDINPASGADFIADLCQVNDHLIPANSFDIIVCTEVLEHTLNPFDAVNEIERLLKNGGVAIISTPFNFRIHGPLPDCWRFTEHGLRQLFKNYVDVQIDAVETKDRDLCPIHYSLTAFKKKHAST